MGVNKASASVGANLVFARLAHQQLIEGFLQEAQLTIILSAYLIELSLGKRPSPVVIDEVALNQFRILNNLVKPIQVFKAAFF